MSQIHPFYSATAALALSGCLSSTSPHTPLPTTSSEPPTKQLEPPNFPVRQDNEPNPGLLRQFEGWSLREFQGFLINRPDRKDIQLSREVAFFYLEMAMKADLYGAEDKLDAGDEVYQAGAILMSFPALMPFGLKVRDIDRDAYLRGANQRLWQQKTDQIRSQYRIDQVPHAGFRQWYEDTFIGSKMAFRGLPVFFNMTAPLLKLVPEIQRNKHLEILYPGGGAHVAPLVTACRLIDSGEIRSAQITFTEIDGKYADHLQSDLAQGVKSGTFEKMSMEKTKTFSEGSEHNFEVTYRGLPIHIRFALKRSGEKYYRPEYLENAHLVIIHDPANSDPKDSYRLLADILLTRRASQKNQAIVMEGRARDFWKWRVGGITLPKDLPQWELSGPYGHCMGDTGVGEIDYCAYETAKLFSLSDKAWNAVIAPQDTVSSLLPKLYNVTP